MDALHKTAVIREHFLRRCQGSRKQVRQMVKLKDRMMPPLLCKDDAMIASLEEDATIHNVKVNPSFVL